MLKYYIVVMIFGRVASFSGPVENHDACRNQAQVRYEQILETAKSKGVTSVQIEGRTATQKDLAVACKVSLTEPRISIDISSIKQ